MLTAVLGALPVLLEILKLFLRTPADQHAETASQLLSRIEALHVAIQKSEDTKGDTGEIEDIVNRS